MSATPDHSGIDRRAMNAVQHGLTAKTQPPAPTAEIRELAIALIEGFPLSQEIHDAAVEAASAILHLRNVSRAYREEVNRLESESTAHHRFQVWFDNLSWISAREWQRLIKAPSRPDPFQALMPPHELVMPWLTKLSEESCQPEAERNARMMKAVLTGSRGRIATIAGYQRKAHSRRDKALNRLDYLKITATGMR